MKYTKKILEHPEFLRIQKEISDWERERIYCHHEIGHALDVCRMAWIMYLEDHPVLRETAEAPEEIKDRIYVSGLLHDIGRAAQYETGEHHALAGGRIASRILDEIAYPVEWKQETIRIISAHHGRTENKSQPGSIEFYIQRADYLSRNCFLCAASDSCKWSAKERNQTVFY